jgi:hypothetical protein
VSDELQSAVEQLEVCLEAADGDIRTLRRASQRLRRLDRAITATIVVGTSVAFIAAVPVASRVSAPFSVVDGAGKTLFVVAADPRGFQLLTESEEFGAGASALTNASFIKVASPDANTQALMGVLGETKPTMTLRYGGRFDRLTLSVVDDNPTLNLVNHTNINIVNLDQGAFGGGRLQLNNAEGNAMVLAGMIANGVGVVRVFPDGNPGRGLFGLPGTFLCGIGCPK